MPTNFGKSFAADQADLDEIKRKKAKRASTISVLSGLGVNISDPEKALEPPASPTESDSQSRRPSKLRNFFGQRPPSELITNHLAEYFPLVEKKVLERTRRQSLMLRASGSGLQKRSSIISWNTPANPRFSVSTMGSHRPNSMLSSRTSMSSFRNPYSPGGDDDTEGAPRMSVSTDSGSDDVYADAETPMRATHPTNRMSSLSLLPPVKFTSGSLSDSLTDLTLPDNIESNTAPNSSDGNSRPVSRALSTASKRMSLITELRSKRRRSDAASLMTVDEITAEMESRRDSGGVEAVVDELQAAFGEKEESAEPLEPEEIIPSTVAEEPEIEEEVEDEDDEEEEDDGEEAEDELTDDEPNKAIMSKQGGMSRHPIFTCTMF